MHIGYPSSARPSLMKHIDGPLLTFRDGRMHWLTPRERFRVWMGWEDAASLERQRRPDLWALEVTTQAQRFTLASSLSRYRRPMWESVLWPAALVFAYCAGILTAMVTP